MACLATAHYVSTGNQGLSCPHHVRAAVHHSIRWNVEIVIAVEHGQLLPQPIFALAQRGDPSPDRGDMLTDGEVDPLHEGGVDVPTKGGQEVIDGLQGTKHHAVLHVGQAPAPHGLHHVRREQPGQWHPAGFGRWTFVLATCWRHPVAIVGQQGRHILPKAIREQERRTVGGHDLRDVVDKALRHGPRAIPDVKRAQECALGVHGDPDPLRRTLQALNGVGLADLTILDRAEQGKQLIELHLPDPYVVQEVLREGSQLIRRLREPLQDRLGSTSHTRAVPRIPKPSARHAMTRTMSSTEARLP